MERITITEALAEVKTIGKRLETKRDFIGQFLFRQQMVKDPLEKDGGSEKAVAAAFQSIADLQQRVIKIRAAIQRANLENTLTIEGKGQSVANWLTWRKEVAPFQQKTLTLLRQSIDKNRQQMLTKGITVGSLKIEQDLRPTDFVVNLDEGDLARRIEALETILGTLDGKLSLFNATATIEL